MSTHLEFELNDSTPTLEQKFTLPKNATVATIALKLHVYNNPTGNFILKLKRDAVVIETITLTSAIINTEVFAQLGQALAYKIGYFLFQPQFLINLRRNVEYTLELSTTGYVFSAASSIGWVKEYVNETNLLLDTPDGDTEKAFSYRLNGLKEYGGFIMPRIVTFFDGQQSATPPDIGSLLKTVTGSDAVPIPVTAAGGIPIADVDVEMLFVEGSPGAVDISANPQIPAGSKVGQELNIYGTDNVKTVLLEDGNGISMNGAVNLDSETNITFTWTGIVWKQSGSFGS